MPTILRTGPYRFFFYATDREEPPHVHIERDDKLAKFWLHPVQLQFSRGFNRVEINRLEGIVQTQREHFWRHGMPISALDFKLPDIENVLITDDTLTVELSDGRTLSVPLAWFPRLLHASPAERRNWRLVGRGHGVHWDDLDEDISIEGLLAGKPSGESQNSFAKWLQGRPSPQS